jgi:hypothetical protein
MAATKPARINPAGKIVPSDRQIHVSRNDGTGVADSVEFRYVGNPTRECKIDFSPYLNRSPFVGGTAAETFIVPTGSTVVQQVDPNKESGEYKYDVLDSRTSELTDDPDVILD